jgi:hypothetical protein
LPAASAKILSDNPGRIPMRNMVALAIAALIIASLAILATTGATEHAAPAGELVASPYDSHPNATVQHFMSIADIF